MGTVEQGARNAVEVCMAVKPGERVILVTDKIVPEVGHALEAAARKVTQNATTIQHYYDKLLRIRGDLVTPTARAMGDERHAFLEAFLHQFFREWDAA